MKPVKNTKRLVGLGHKFYKERLNKTRVIFHYGPAPADQRIYELAETCAMFKHLHFDKRKPTVLYIHGYVEAPWHQSVDVIVKAYLKRNDHNILVLDWSDLADGNYLLDALSNMKQMATKMSEVILDWVDEGLDIEKFHIVGHSLGAQMAGLIGRNAHRKSEGETQIIRITGLDPAFPAFYPPIGATPINKHDAVFVDIIHTDAWIYGAPKSTGTVDFWPNGGKTLQPGCPRRNYKPLSENDLCSHRRSWWFWAESVETKDRPTFLAARAKTWNDFKKGRTDNTPVIEMGINCPIDAIKGDYFLQTNGCKPFAKSAKGLQYEKQPKCGL